MAGKTTRLRSGRLPGGQGARAPQGSEVTSKGAASILSWDSGSPGSITDRGTAGSHPLQLGFSSSAEVELRIYAIPQMTPRPTQSEVRLRGAEHVLQVPQEAG